MLRILILEPEYFDRSSVSLLGKAGKVTARRMSRKELEARIKDFDAVMVRIETRLDKRLLSKARRLRVIGSATTGLDHIDMRYARKKGIKVFSLYRTHTTPTAEHTMALMLALVRKLPWAHDSLSRGEWRRHMFIGTQLSGKTLGIIGFGNIGRAVARLAKPFGMRIQYYDPYIKSGAAKRIGLRSLLSSSDIITIHAGLSGETRGMLGPKEFAAMKKRPFVINTARGEIVDNVQLIRALKSGRIRGAALDVFPHEPVSGGERAVLNYARKNQKLLLTPHIGASTHEALHDAGLSVAKAVVYELKSK